MGFPLPIHGAAFPANPIPARAGVGLRFPHHDLVMAERPPMGWLEVHPENYLGEGTAAEILQIIRRDYPLSLHATGLSLGSAGGVDAAHLSRIAELCRRIAPGLVSDHLSWSSADGAHLPDLLPLPYTQEALEIFADNIDRVQTALGRAILIENPSVYLAFADCEMDEGAFLAALVARTGCGLLLDVNNVAVSAANLGEDPNERLAALLDILPADAIGEIHLAGHAVQTLPDGGEVRIDDHGSPVSRQVWALFETVIQRLGVRPALIEWDTAIPPFAVLADEAKTADAFLLRAQYNWRSAYAAAG